MKKYSNYFYVLLLLVGFSLTAQGQYLCDFEYKVINKQKKKVKRKCKKLAEAWLIEKRDSLKLPMDLKLSKVKFMAEEKEINKVLRYNRWWEIDSLLCVKKKPDYAYAETAKKRLSEMQLVVFDIRTDFDYIPTPNAKISSTLNFEFDINGNLIRAVIRKKKMSPFSEIPIE